MAEEREFEVVDRRRIHANGPADAAAAGNEAVGEQPESHAVDGETLEEELEIGAPEGMPAMEMGVTAILVTTWNLLIDRAWAALGLVPDPITGKIGKDLPEARRAIDALADVIKHLEPEATDAEKREMQGNLSNLRINYVRLAG